MVGSWKTSCLLGGPIFKGKLLVLGRVWVGALLRLGDVVVPKNGWVELAQLHSSSWENLNLPEMRAVPKGP